MVKYHKELACLLQLTAAFCSLLQLASKVKYPVVIYSQSYSWDHSVNHVHYIVVSIAFLIKISKSIGQLGHCCKTKRLQQLILLLQVGLWKRYNFLSKRQFKKKKKLQSLRKSLPLNYVLHCIFHQILKRRELAVINHPKCSNLQQPLYSLMFHCLLHTATPSSITNYHLW